MRSSFTIDRRRLIALAAAPVFVRHARAADEPRFALGIASGCPLPDRLVLWTRLTGDTLPPQVDVDWELADDETFTRIAARGRETAEAAWAHSVHAEPAGLAPGRHYFYRFTALGQRSAVGRTCTAPAPDAQATLRFAIASCQRFDHGHYAAWRHLAADPPELVLFLGDYIYEYASPRQAIRPHDGGLLRTLADYRARYAQYKRDPALQAAHAACPWLVSCDDHEVENDYAGERGSSLQGEALLQLRAAAYQAAWEHQPLPKAWRPQGAAMRLHGRWDWGRLARFQVVDGRQHRDPQACLPPGRSGGSASVDAAACAALRDPQRSLLGPAQEQWLADGWDAQRPWNLLAQPTLMARCSTRPWRDVPAETPQPPGRYWNDGWDGYAAARTRLLEGIAARRLPNAVALGGDVHAHYVADLKADFDDARAPVVASEFCGTSISSHGWAQRQVDAVLALNPHLHHGRADQRGYMHFTLDARRLDARLMAVERPDDPASPVGVQARFAVEDGRPGPQRA